MSEDKFSFGESVLVPYYAPVCLPFGTPVYTPFFAPYSILFEETWQEGIYVEYKEDQHFVLVRLDKQIHPFKKCKRREDM